MMKVINLNFLNVQICSLLKNRIVVVVAAEILNMDVKPYTFSYSELKTATQDFNPSNKLGEGGFGSVYKVRLKPTKWITYTYRGDPTLWGP